MRSTTRAAFNAYLLAQASLHGLASGADLAHGFTVTPTRQQRLEEKIQESADFLKRINVVPVIEQEGAVLGLGIAGPIASRTDTSGAGRRTPRETHTLEERTYRCEKTNYDTKIRYATLDTWAKFPDFQLRVRGQVVTRCGLDRIMIGFNGASVAANTNLANFPLLQDVNKGWLQHIREDAPAQRMGHGQLDANKVYVDGAARFATPQKADYANLDALVVDAIQLLDPWYRESTDLVAICGRDLMHDKYFPIIDQDEKPTEILAGQVVVSQKRMGGLPAVTVPFFPANAILVTSLDNLSIYYQEGARRSRTKDAPEADQIETYESSNDAYVVEEYGKVAFIENIQLGPKA